MARALVVGLLALALCGCDLGIQAASGRAPTGEGETAPALPRDPSGLLGMSPRALSWHAQHMQGRALLVHIWASFCGSCKRELPMLRALQQTLAADGVQLVMLSADEPEDRGAAVALLREAGMPGPSHYLLGGIEPFRAELEPRWEGALPATLLLDTEGRVRFFWNGPVLDEELRPVVQGLLAGEPIDGMRDLAAKPPP